MVSDANVCTPEFSCLIVTTDEKRFAALEKGIEREKMFDCLSDFSIAMSGIALTVGAVLAWINSAP